MSTRPSTSREIQAATGLSQSSVARRLREMEDTVVQLPMGRSIRYAATCNAFGGNDKLPLSMVDEGGHTALIAYIRPPDRNLLFAKESIENPQS